MAEAGKGDQRITTIVYLLQALSFFFGVTYLIAVVINYVKLEDVRHTWLASHFYWQIRTFWYSLLWFVIGFLTSFLLVGYLLLAFNLLWVIYRITKGYLSLREGREMYTPL
ncbi:MAG: hypothetical protein HQL48_11800 [Gammaproteobacteria bacterium]|nr:hypothetical protein [Gammaproteobacteria bacterium]